MSDRHGAPATMIRTGQTSGMSTASWRCIDVRAEPFRFHLDRDRDLVTTRSRRSGCSPGSVPPARARLQFFIAEEGATAVAYVVMSVRGNEWTLEECGDRDPAGARVGAHPAVADRARAGASAHPTIRAWLPPGFLPPQLTIAATRPSSEVMMVRPLTPAAESARTLGADDVLYWRSDMF